MVHFQQLCQNHQRVSWIYYGYIWVRDNDLTVLPKPVIMGIEFGKSSPCEALIQMSEMLLFDQTYAHTVHVRTGSILICAYKFTDAFACAQLILVMHISYMHIDMHLYKQRNVHTGICFVIPQILPVEPLASTLRSNFLNFRF